MTVRVKLVPTGPVAGRTARAGPAGTGRVVAVAVVVVEDLVAWWPRLQPEKPAARDSGTSTTATQRRTMTFELYADTTLPDSASRGTIACRPVTISAR